MGRRSRPRTWPAARRSPAPIRDFPDHFGFFLPLAGITTVKQIRENSFDIRATSRLNRLYVELLKDNPDWGTAERRHDMNHFMARLIFCFFAEDTDIFNGTGLFTATIEQMSARDSSNTHEVIGELFRAMNTKIEDRASAKTAPLGRRLSLCERRAVLGQHGRAALQPDRALLSPPYRQSRLDEDQPGHLRVDDPGRRGGRGARRARHALHERAEHPEGAQSAVPRRPARAAGGGRRQSPHAAEPAQAHGEDPGLRSGLRLRQLPCHRLQGNAGDRGRDQPAARRSRTAAREIPLTNFRGIELRDFPAEIARLALIIAEFQCDVLYRGQKEALAEFLPLDAQNWITCGNALRLDWLSICPPTGTGVKHHADDLFHTPLDQAQIDFENEGGETYICGNPPYQGSTKANEDTKG